MPRGSSRLLLALLGLVVVTGCATPQGPARPAAVSLNGAGATFPYPLYSKWFSDYHAAHPQVQISYQSIGSGGGIQALKSRTVDFGASDAPLSDAELKAMPATVVHIPTAAGAVAVIYHLPGFTQPLHLDGDVLTAIYLGRITRWNAPQLAALNPGAKLPGTAITVAHRSDGSGTSYLFTSYLSAVSKEWAQKVGAGKSVSWPVGVGGKGNEGVSGTVKQLPGTIGYVELAYAARNGLNCAELRNAAGKFVAPSAGGVTAAAAGAVERMKQDVRASIVNSPAPEAYPISGFTYLLVYQDQPDRGKGEALAQFLSWAMQDGQKDAAPMGYAPLPQPVIEINRAALKRLTLQGKPLSSGK